MGLFDPGELGVPGGGTGVGDASKFCLHLLIGTLGLSVGLGVKSGGEAGCGTKSLTERTPNLGGELGTSVGHYVRWDAMQAENVPYKEVGGLL